MGVKTYSDPCYIFVGGRTSQTPQDLRPCFPMCINQSNRINSQTHFVNQVLMTLLYTVSIPHIPVHRHHHLRHLSYRHSFTPGSKPISSTIPFHHRLLEFSRLLHLLYLNLCSDCCAQRLLVFTRLRSSGGDDSGSFCY